MKRIITVLSFALVLFSACAQSSKEKLEVKTFQKELSASPNAVVLDVRSEGEFQGGHLAKALNMNYNAPNFADNMNRLDKSKTYFVYCAAGVRSARAAALMRDAGFKNVLEMKGGLNDWQANNLPVEK
jgi:rhodanese-related sulfurtransferase